MLKQCKILVVDDSRQARHMVSRFVMKMGHTCITAQSGPEAIQAFMTEAPDLILMDVKMPEMDGYETAQRIRQQADSPWTPILFLSASAEDDDQVKGLEAGGDDYLIKPIRYRMLKAKIQAMQRILDMQRTLHENAAQLALHRDETEREQQLAMHLMDHIIRDDVQEENVQRWVMPAQNFSGDLLATMHAPSGALHSILSDGTGHGLSAALSVMPVAEIFMRMTQRGHQISSIARELNRKLKQLMPTGRFVAATLACVDWTARTIELWNGGNPAAFFVNQEGCILRQWDATHLALGILSDQAFDARTELYQWQEPGQLYMYSDGLTEAQNARGEDFGEERLLQVLASTASAGRFMRLKTLVDDFLGGEAAHDDVSLVAVDCAMESVVSAPSREHPDVGKGLTQPERQWRVHVELSVTELQSLDVMPWLMWWMDNIELEEQHRGQVFLILSELLNNALDHGLLGLDSRLKAESGGFERYIQMRTDRLAALSVGFIDIEIGPVWQAGRELLQLGIKDSGPGFDHVATSQADLTDNTGFSGRGIGLVRDLCETLEYRGNGNEVVALYPLR